MNVSRRIARRVMLCLACAPLVTGAWAWSATATMCDLRARTTVPLIQVGDQYLIRVSINGKALLLEPDTGAIDTLLKPNIADSLNLPNNSGHVLNVSGVGSPATREHTRIVSSLQIGAVQWTNVDIATAPTGLPEPIAGILGADVLSRYDLEIDYLKKTLTLWSTPGCLGRITPWKTGRYVVYRPNFTLDHRFFVTVRVNGQPLQALIDTGAHLLLMSSAAAKKAGVDETRLASDRITQAVGIGGAPFSTRLHRFDSLQVGPARYRNVDIAVSDKPLPQDLLLGVNFLKWHRVWLSYSTGWVFMQDASPVPGIGPSGAPVYDAVAP